jgi:hypothetical protein
VFHEIGCNRDEAWSRIGFVGSKRTAKVQTGDPMPTALRIWSNRRLITCLGLLAGAAFLAGCGSDSGSMGGPVAVRITITGAPNTPMSPGQRAQLSASALLADGSVRDVTAVATWETTDRGVLTVSAGGSLVAAGPGRADVVATFGGARDALPVTVIVLPAAYFLNGLEYAFEYQLDAKERVTSYRISRKPEIDYGDGFGQNSALGECQGDLYGTYACTWMGINAMRGESGRVVYVSTATAVSGTTTYGYGSLGLAEVATSWRGPTSHAGGSDTTTLTYDAQGKLASARRDDRCYDLGGTRGIRSTASIAVNAQGRLSHAEYHSEEYGNPWSCALWGNALLPVGIVGPTDWTYDSRGYMISAGATTYIVDADGWLSQRSEGEGASAVIDTYAIVREGTRVAEESFTQAEPRAHYIPRGPQRIRYEWGRLPSEPLFVPRALTGLNGADYFGVVSSHHR